MNLGRWITGLYRSMLWLCFLSTEVLPLFFVLFGLFSCFLWRVSHCPGWLQSNLPCSWVCPWISDPPASVSEVSAAISGLTCIVLFSGCWFPVIEPNWRPPPQHFCLFELWEMLPKVTLTFLFLSVSFCHVALLLWPWLTWNSFWRPGLSWTERGSPACLLSAGTKGRCYPLQMTGLEFLVFSNGIIGRTAVPGLCRAVEEI